MEISGYPIKLHHFMEKTSAFIRAYKK